MISFLFVIFASSLLVCNSKLFPILENVINYTKQPRRQIITQNQIRELERYFEARRELERYLNSRREMYFGQPSLTKVQKVNWKKEGF
jgi:hypothetical protein